MDVSDFQEQHENKVGEAMTLRVVVLLCLLGGCLLALVAVLVAPPENAEAAARGVVDIRLERVLTDLTAVDNVIADMGAGSLRARWTRIIVDWSKVQPNAPAESDPGYDAAYVEQLKSISAKLEAAGINVIVTPYLVPKWASNKTLWNSPPRGGYLKGKYEPFYAMDTSNAAVMDAFQAMCTYLAKTLSPAPYGVRHFELGNEPNLYCYQYPQTRHDAPYYGASTYLKMLKRFYKGVKAANHSAVVIAGANSPRGNNDALSTSPQRFAKYLKAHGAAKYFDAYSHHPYHTGGSRSPAPDKPPLNTRKAVTLYNIGQLLRLFPGKPFYLTEYGYTTKRMPQFGEGVTQAQQASYLRKAYSMVAKYRQIKVLLWYLVQDFSSVYTGLRGYSGDADLGARKLSWYAFAGGNSLSLTAPRSMRASKPFTLKGVLRVRGGFLPGQTMQLQLQSRSPLQSAWSTVKSKRTDSDGKYAFALKQKSTKYYRVRWNGVCESVKRLVRTP
jgi:Cellulase (glycosyl hydrolase family 5).